MRIIIVGCGKVGRTLAEQLDYENHEIVLIEKDPDVLTETTDALDIIGVEGNGASDAVLKEAGADKADLLIAVTPTDELNLLCCLIAKKLGVGSTIARVRNPEYAQAIPLVQRDLGLSLVINPEFAAAQEMAQLLRFPSAIDVDTFVKGRVEIFKLRVPKESPLNGIKVYDISHHIKVHILVCVVERGTEVIIPSGDCQIQEGDTISVVAPREHITKFFKWAGVLAGRINNTIIVGGGRISFYLARRLLEDGIDVKIIERDKERCEELSQLLPKAVILHGSGADHEMLMEEGIAGADSFAALTDIDEENVLLALYAAAKSDAKIITKISHPALNEIVADMPIGSIISPRLITAELILRYVRAMQNSLGSNVETLYKLNDSVEALEFRVGKGFPSLGTPLLSLKLKKNLLIACINRKGKIIIPGGQDYIDTDDTVIVVTTNTGLDDLNDILQS